MALHIKFLDGLLAFIRTRRGKIVTGLVAIILSTIILLPHAISYGVRDWLNNNGADQTHVEDVNFNLFTGKLEFISLRVTVANDFTLLLQNAWVNTDWLPLFHKTFHIKELYVEDANIVIEQKPDGQLVFAGITPKTETTAEQAPASESVSDKTDDQSEPWGFSLETLNISNSHFRYLHPDLNLQLAINKATLSGLHTAQAEAATFALSGTLNDTALSIDAKLTPFAAKPGVDAKITLAGLPLTNFKQIVKQHVDIQSGSLGLDINIKAYYGKDSGLSIDEDGRIALNDLGIAQAGSQVNAGAIIWQGALKAVISTDDKPLDMQLEGGVNASALAVTDQQNNSKLLNIASLQIDKLLLSPSQLHVNELAISTLVANLQRNEKGAIVLPSAQTAQAEPKKTAEKPTTDDTATPADKEAEQAEASSPAFGLRVDHIAIADNSKLEFSDKSTTPDFTSTISLNSIDIRALDNNKPEQATQFTLAGKIGKFSTLNAKGSVHPFAKKLSLKMDAKLKAMEMPPLSSYTSGTLGYNLLNGQLNTDIKVSIKNDVIDVKSKLFLNNLEVKELTVAEKKKINTTASAPLSLGISMLSDRHNNIELELPFEGNVNDPNIDISDAVNQVIGKAVSTAALTYLKLSLQPFGALLAIAEAAGDVSNGVQLQPVLFNSASTQLDANAIQYKTNIAKILIERPQLRIKVCGIASSRDRDYLVAKQLKALKDKQAKNKKSTKDKKEIAIPVIADDKLLEIALQRADNLKAALINEHKIGPERLFSCLPTIDPKPDTDPRVEIGI